WKGTQYIRNAGQSKEDNSFNATDYFEVLLDNQALSQSVPWYWNITDYPLNGVKINQNKTTIRLSPELTAEQMKAVKEGASRLTVRVANRAVAGNDGTPANNSVVYPVAYKPYYDKMVTSKTGILVKGSEFVDIRTVQKTADIIDVILSAAPQLIIEKMRTSNVFCIFGPGEHSYNIPEHRGIFIRDAWDRAEGYGGFVAATSACNVERNGTHPADYYPEGYASRYADECILAHEFGHGIHSAFNAVYPEGSSLRDELAEAFAHVTANNMWTPYIREGRGGSEYFATLTAVWYNAMAESNSAGCNTREELYLYDRKGYDFFSKIFSSYHMILDENWGDVLNTAHPSSR
ncbi:hypothetical protein LJB97_01410, partial [Parabacteroides sp. OttesenSCG-928-O15]|nr:hypothetical protein [Parabacteroides sp. OttesenSCG-928-O15]